MRLSDGVEWALHCCTVLAALPSDQALPAARLAEFHGVPPAYLAKHLQALTAAGITTSLPGPLGGYRLARPPADISVLDVVLTIDGDDTAFRCSEVRRRGPAAGPESAYRRPCGIARVMWKAEDAWRAELAATSIGDLVLELLTTVPQDQLAKGSEWIRDVDIRRRTRREEGSNP
jgi:Rrf2 family protein